MEGVYTYMVMWVQMNVTWLKPSYSHVSNNVISNGHHVKLHLA